MPKKESPLIEISYAPLLRLKIPLAATAELNKLLEAEKKDKDSPITGFYFHHGVAEEFHVLEVRTNFYEDLGTAAELICSGIRDRGFECNADALQKNEVATATVQ